MQAAGCRSTLIPSLTLSLMIASATCLISAEVPAAGEDLIHDRMSFGLASEIFTLP